jgi:hypothetical protein
MGFDYLHLEEPDVRQAMASAWHAEWADLKANWPRDCCYGKQLTDQGWDAFERVMPEALAERDEQWLFEQMSPARYWVETLSRRTKSGVTQVLYNKEDALQKLTLGEFNIAYIHGLAQALTNRGEVSCVVYRADDAYVPRAECSAWEDRQFPLADVLTGHRARYFPPPGDPRVWSELAPVLAALRALRLDPVPSPAFFGRQVSTGPVLVAI